MGNLIVVAGAGPAGSEAGRVIAESGRDVLILERKEKGAQSARAGGVGRHWIEEMGLDLPREVICEEIRTVRINSPNESFTIRASDLDMDYLGWVTDRSSLDTWLQERAEKAGVRVERGVIFRDF